MDITLYHKSDQALAFQYFESDGTTARDLTGATVYLTAKTNSYSSTADDSDALFKVDVTDHTDPTNGQTTISITNAMTNITPGKYHYDIKVKEADNKVYLAQSGICTLTATPTNRA